ncbi:hypothetical protein CBR_g37315 [Chara braunii]|uniref:CCHC-type domain-containing protein n=1 Tax=Chara braunii TaxID=69332 RepID=A0A388JZJ2_CHABU|nr:hypothetical protein CBR_g37315 [Chara braunii]|eukprot:GBG63229.1 hypothetical protein CBR_g37315 [Chara braunii]
MFLTSGPTGDNTGNMNNGQMSTNNEVSNVGTGQNAGNWNGYQGGGGRAGMGGNGNVCYNCGKPGHIARDCWSRQGRGDTNTHGDPELEEIKEHFRLMRKERLESEEKRRLEEERKAKEEEELRRNLDFARKAEEFKLQLRVELLEEWRRNNQEAEKASGSLKKSPKEKRGMVQKTSKSRRRGRAKKKRTDKSSDETDTEDPTEEDSSDIATIMDSEDSPVMRTPRGKKKKAYSRSRYKKNTADTANKAAENTLLRTFERGECSRLGRTDPGDTGRHHATNNGEFQMAEEEGRGEPKTPLTGGYKGIAAGCSQKGLIDYCISAHKIYSAKKADVLRRICDQKGIKYTTKPEAVEILARHQVQLAYDGFEETSVVPKDGEKTKALGLPRKTYMKEKEAGGRPTPRTAPVIIKSFNLSKREGYVLTRFSELAVPHFLRNSKNISRPARACEVSTIRRAICEATMHLKGNSVVSITPEAVFTNREINFAAWSDEQIKDWGSRFEGLVLTPEDRKQGDTAVFCPVLYRHGFGKTFAWNSNYVTIGSIDDEVSILKKAREYFLMRGLDSIGKWKPDGRLGTAYVILKQKDLARWRPIAPAPADHVGLATRRTARALHCLPTRLPANNTFLNSVGELAERLKATTQRLRAAGCIQAVGRCYDIKEMFSRIPHGSIIQAVHQLLRRYENDGWKQVDHVVWTSVTPGQMLSGNARGSRRLRCKLCNKEYSGNRKRAWEHFILARAYARCPHSNLSIWRRLHGIGVQLPTDLHEMVQRMLEMEKSDEEDTPVAGGGEGGKGGIAEDPREAPGGDTGEVDIAEDEGTRGGARTHGPVKQMSIRRFAKNPRQEDINDSCCEFVVENTIPFNTARSRSFKKFMLTCIGPQLVGSHPLVPTRYNPLRCRVLDRLNKRLVDEKQAVRDDWQVTGCTFITDGATNICGRSLMNYILAGRSKPVFVKCEDVSEGDKDSAVVVAGWKRFFREWGVEKITAICTDSFVGNLSAARMLREDPEFRQIYWIPCTTHCMDLLMHDIGKKEWADVIITKANKVVNFFRVHRFGTNYVMLQRLEVCERAIVRVVTGHGWETMLWRGDIRAKADFVEDTVLDKAFWADVKKLTAVMKGPYNVLQEVDKDVHCLSRIYDMACRFESVMERLIGRGQRGSRSRLRSSRGGPSRESCTTRISSLQRSSSKSSSKGMRSSNSMRGRRSSSNMRGMRSRINRGRRSSRTMRGMRSNSSRGRRSGSSRGRREQQRVDPADHRKTAV